jgi:hypothetical protein
VPAFTYGNDYIEFQPGEWIADDEDAAVCRADGNRIGTAEPYLERMSFSYGSHPVDIYEVSYWPLLNYMKCRYLVGVDTALIGTQTEAYRLCESRFPRSVDGAQRTPGSPPTARANKVVKSRLFEWGFGDAVLSTGPVGDAVHRSIISALDCVARDHDADGVTIIITESLGSYLLIEALLDANPTAEQARAIDFVANADSIYMLANQWALLSLADIAEDGRGPITAQRLNALLLERRTARGENAIPEHGIGQIVAFNDPNDVLTYQTPEYFEDVTGALEGDETPQPVINVTIAVTPTYLGLIANPIAAHLNYRADADVLDLMVGR